MEMFIFGIIFFLVCFAIWLSYEIKHAIVISPDEPFFKDEVSRKVFEQNNKIEKDENYKEN